MYVLTPSLYNKFLNKRILYIYVEKEKEGKIEKLTDRQTNKRQIDTQSTFKRLKIIKFDYNSRVEACELPACVENSK